MATNDIRTSHDLADVLEDAAKALRRFPELSLSNLDQILAEATSVKQDLAEVKPTPAKFNLEELAKRLPTLERSDAESEVVNLTVDSIRQLSSLLGIRLPSKATKAQATSMLLAQVFDIPAGQELIRTFHQRKAAR